LTEEVEVQNAVQLLHNMNAYDAAAQTGLPWRSGISCIDPIGSISCLFEIVLEAYNFGILGVNLVHKKNERVAISSDTRSTSKI